MNNAWVHHYRFSISLFLFIKGIALKTAKMVRKLHPSCAIMNKHNLTTTARPNVFPHVMMYVMKIS